MFKFRVLVQFSYNNDMYNPRRQTYQLDDEIVKEWESSGYVKIVEKSAKDDKKTKEE
ncbi:hypothetical protein [Bacillus sp. 1NLA3E]|uniref:hypothetical protein n=1 Tax=Bacillus sp. 1NLA3E TaxID=666686 RepID=UPI000247E64E|nr:hypothetical protein [Bacillus sp. 1NLA3E]